MAKRKKEPTYYPPGTILQYDGPMGFYPVEVLNWDEISEGYDNRGLRVLGEARIRNVRTGKERLEMQFRLHKPKTPNPGKHFHETRITTPHRSATTAGRITTTTTTSHTCYSSFLPRSSLLLTRVTS